MNRIDPFEMFTQRHQQNDNSVKSMRSQLISGYKFSKAGKVKQLRLGNWREQRSVNQILIILHVRVEECVMF